MKIKLKKILITVYFLSIILNIIFASLYLPVIFKHSPVPSRNSYPTIWKNAPKDSLGDSWRMNNRECVSYTAWKVYETYHYMPIFPDGYRDAKFWVIDAINAKIPTGIQPMVHSVGIKAKGTTGHSVWVEHINPNGTIHISQYNANEDGQYGEDDISPVGYTFIYFNSNIKNS
jgi:surface antigen